MIQFESSFFLHYLWMYVDLFNQKRYIGAEKFIMYQLRMYLCQLRTISSEKKTHILKKTIEVQVFRAKK